MSTAPLPASRAEAIVAGTLCLMSCFAHQPLAQHAERIAHNLACLAEASEVTPELRTVCRRLSDRWDAIALHLKSRAPATLGAPSAVH